MKVLIYCINYAPEIIGAGKYNSDMANWLSARGHEVRVVTSPPYYPEWKIKHGYSSLSYKFEVIQNVCVWRCPLWIPKRDGGLVRILHLLSFSISSSVIMLKQLFWKPQIVWVVTPTIMCVPTALLLSRLTNSACWVHIQDYEVDAAFSLGLLKSKFWQKIALKCEKFFLCHADIVSTISKKMLDLAIQKGVDTKKTFLFSNWVDISSIKYLSQDDPTPQMLRMKLGIKPTQIVALYSGNIANKQGIEILAEVANLAKQDDVMFVFCGDGIGKTDLIKGCMKLNNVMFLPLQPNETFSTLLSLADIHLLPQKSGVSDLVLPSKLIGMLMSGRPVVVSAEKNTELANVVSLCGIVTEPGNSIEFYNAIKTLRDSSHLRNKLGLNARRHAETNFDRKRILESFESKLYSFAK